jgi:hypothetical protein
LFEGRSQVRPRPRSLAPRPRLPRVLFKSSRAAFAQAQCSDYGTVDSVCFEGAMESDNRAGVGAEPWAHAEALHVSRGQGGGGVEESAHPLSGLGSCLSKSPPPSGTLSSRGGPQQPASPTDVAETRGGLSARKTRSRGEKRSELPRSWRRAWGTGAEVQFCPGVQLPVLGHPPRSLHSILPLWRSVFSPDLLRAAVARPGFYSVVKFYSARDAQRAQRACDGSYYFRPHQ